MRVRKIIRPHTAGCCSVRCYFVYALSRPLFYECIAVDASKTFMRKDKAIVTDQLQHERILHPYVSRKLLSPIFSFNEQVVKNNSHSFCRSYNGTTTAQWQQSLSATSAAVEKRDEHRIRCADAAAGRIGARARKPPTARSRRLTAADQSTDDGRRQQRR